MELNCICFILKMEYLHNESNKIGNEYGRSDTRETQFKNTVITNRTHLEWLTILN